jgi:hypothetical protein
MANPVSHGAAAAAPFLPGGKICRSRHGKEAGVIAWGEYGLY